MALPRISALSEHRGLSYGALGNKCYAYHARLWAFYSGI